MGAGANLDSFKRKLFSNAVSQCSHGLQNYCRLTGGANADSVEASKDFLVKD